MNEEGHEAYALSMRPPSTVKVGHRTYKITLLDHIQSETGVVGFCGNDVQEILIDKNQAGANLQDTVLHELGHAMFHLASLGKDYGGTIKSDDEERVLRVLTPLLLDLLQRNPKLVAYLTGRA